jgi:peptidoglycan/xylan/chitin deacetylase (PgdA/CDA1 family)
MFHGIGGSDFPQPAFERILRYLKEAFDVVSLDQGLDALATDRVMRPPKVVLTFDDGLRNHHEVAYPLLKQMKMPAVFYVCPGLIDNAEWQWPHEVRQRLLSLSPIARKELMVQTGSTTDEIEPFIDWMKSLVAPHARETLQSIRAATVSFQRTEEMRRQYDVMSWEALLSLDPSIITVGSHTVSHPILTSLDSRALEFEIEHSRRQLEARLQRPVAHFCYPNGSTDNNVRNVVARHYSSAVITKRGYTYAGADRMMIPRIDANPPRLRMMWRLHRAHRQRQ